MSIPTTSPRRPRVLMFAYACRPNEGSEPGMGWNRALEAAREFDMWVICEGHRNAPAIRAYLEKHGEIPGLQFAFLPASRTQRWMAKTPGLFYVAYHLWQRQALRLAEQLHSEHRFDLTHQVTYCGYREPGYGWKLPIPFLWGPVGGTHNFPARFLSQAGFSGAIEETTRSLFNNLQFTCSRHIRQAGRRAALVLAGNTTSQRHLSAAFGKELQLLPASGIVDELAEPRSCRGGKKLRMLWCGNLIPLKGLPVLLRALATLPVGFDFELRIVGDGPYRATWQHLTKKLGIEQHVVWSGRIPHEQVRAQYEWADALVFTSLRDTFPTVVLEALSTGLPVICFDHLGMRDIVDASCGIKIPLTNPQQAIVDFREAIRTVASESHSWEQMSRGAVARARGYTWNQQGKQLARIYRQLLGMEEESKTALPEEQAELARDPS